MSKKKAIVNQLNTKKIKCLFIIDRLMAFAGTEKHLYQLIKYINKEKFQIKVVVFIDASIPIIGKFINESVDIEVLQLKKIYGLKAIAKFPKLVSIIRKYQPDIVQTFHFNSDTYGVIAAKIAGVPHIISSRRDMGDLKRPRQIILNRIINRYIEKYISVCNKTGEKLAILEKISKDKIQTIYNGIDLKKYENNTIEKLNDTKCRLGYEKTNFVIGIACILRDEKDVFLFLSAMADLKSEIKELKVLVVGDGKTKKDLQEYAVKKGLKDIAYFTGYVSDISEYVYAMDIACLTPKSNEGLSNSILEKMAMGKPIIATDVGGNAELIVDGKTGFIVPVGDKNALIEKIKIIYKDQKLRNEMGKCAFERIAKNFTIEKMIKKHEEFYTEINQRV